MAILQVLIAVGFLVLLTVRILTVPPMMNQLSDSYASDLPQPYFHSQAQQHKRITMSQCSAQSIVQDAYQTVYAPFVQNCTKDKDYYTCLQESEAAAAANHDSVPSPWWFRHLIRQVPHPLSGISALWHFLWFDDPPVKFCTIEKVGTRSWRDMHIEYHHGNVTGKYWESAKPNMSNVPMAVFTRDPLERFLSAFMNKCLLNSLAVSEKHCQPESENIIEFRKGLTDHQHFDSFVSIMPLSWNVHFAPQAMYCNGLFRTIDDYDFVGSMDSDTF
eukprot:scaffold607408_cov173-Attheya_sp.AAC.1